MRSIILDKFKHLESSSADQAFHAAESVLLARVTSLDQKLADWAAWDDTYQFVIDKNKSYQRSNLSAESMRTLSIQLIGIYDRNGNLAFGGYYPDDSNQRQPLSESFREHFHAKSWLLKFENIHDSKHGILTLPEGLIIFASRPIITSEALGPSRGTIVFAKYIGDAEIEKLSEVAKQKLSLTPIQLSRYSEEGPANIEHRFNTSVDEVQYRHAENLRDAHGQPIAELAITLNRDIMNQGKEAISTFGHFLLVFGVAFTLMALTLGDRFVLNRIVKLGNEVRKLEASRNFDQRLLERGRDEISALTHSFNRLLDRIGESQSSLLELSQRLQLVIDASSAGVWDWDLTTNKVFFDHKWKTMLGYTPSEIPDELESFGQLMHPDDAERVWQEARDFADGYMAEYSVRFRMRAKDGSYRWIVSEAQVLRDQNRKATRMVGFHRDITAQVLQETLMEKQRVQLIQSSKLSALGEMAGGVAHEINNPLAIIQGVAGQIESRLNSRTLDPERLKKYSKTISDTVDRIAKIVRSMRSLARDGSQDPKIQTDFESILNETLALCQERIKCRGINLEVKKESENLTFWCRPSEIVQVILNLLNNAIDAMSEAQTPEPWIRISFGQKENFVEISIENAGDPIPHHIQDKLFQPFYSTKEIGKGTGLGLSISRGLVENHQGTILYDRGAQHPRFVIHLPVLSAENTLKEIKS